MKFIKWIKWIFSFLILVGALTGIILGTNYILNNNGLKKIEKKETKHTIEKITSNENKTNLTEIYNIYLNKEKHKVKIEYQIMNRSDGSLFTILYIYFDGKKSLEREFIALQDVTTIKEVFAFEESLNVKIDDSDFKILKEEEKEYLLINVGLIEEFTRNYYFIINDNGDIVDDKGILVNNRAYNYLMNSGEEFSNYYDNDNKTLAKIDSNYIYALEEKQDKKKLNLVEYKYYLKNGKLKKEEIQVYEDIKLDKKDILKKD